jgi:hypothetical protein
MHAEMEREFASTSLASHTADCVVLAFGKKFSTLLKTPFMAASKLGNNFTEHETAIHTCSQCSHKLQKENQLESTPALHSGPSKRNTQCGSKWVGKYAIRNTQYAMGENGGQIGLARTQYATRNTQYAKRVKVGWM